MNTYILSFSSKNNMIARQTLLDFLDTRKEILNWYAPMPFTVLIISRETLKVVSTLIRNRFSNNITFLLSEVEPSTIDGFIDKRVWDFINNPKSSGRWE